jgi:CheY-like chemotaxis protein
LNDIISIAKQTFPKSIKVKTNIPSNLWAINGDATQFHQVMLNLCLNAKDAMPSGGILSLGAQNYKLGANKASLYPGATAGRHIMIAISDTGTGIPREVLDRIFDPFFTTKGPGKGTGLGLSTSMSIIRGHGGFLDVYSEVGEGTTFKVYLPAAPETIAVPEKAEVIAELGGHGETILVVDDEEILLDITASTLEHNGYKVPTAADGIEATALYARHIDLIRAVIVDMVMPNLDGPSTIKVLTRINPSLRIIAVSGLAEASGDIHREINSGTVHAFLSKPVEAHKLLTTLREVLSGSGK